VVLQITPHEREALQLLANGAGAPGIADRLGVSEHEVEAHLVRLFARMGAATRTEAVAVASRRGLLIVDVPSLQGAR
jgi:two-component system, NarL family, nitrate/nitrite response regulator NarL